MHGRSVSWANPRQSQVNLGDSVGAVLGAKLGKDDVGTVVEEVVGTAFVGEADGTPVSTTPGHARYRGQHALVAVQASLLALPQ